VILFTFLTEVAFSTGDSREDSDPITFLEVGDSITGADYFACTLVAGNHWKIGRERPMIQVVVRHTHTTSPDFNDYVVFTGTRLLSLLNCDLSLAG
jgi:hypothetical protein